MRSGYQETLEYLYGFVNFEHRRMDQYTQEYINLDRPRQFLAGLGDPHDSYPTIHIAGTKGKGSVAVFCASSLRHAGLSVGLYTSPHLQDFRDRIRILRPTDSDGRISQDQVVELTGRLRPAIEQTPGLTWYEIVTALAFLHFAEAGVDAAVIEVGLGGRLDATNVIRPLVSVITSLSLDHTMLLGNNIVEIAREKGGIIKSNIPTVTAPQPPEALAELERIAAQRESPITVIGRQWDYDKIQEPSLQGSGPYRWRPKLTVTKSPEGSPFPPPIEFDLNLIGRHQQENAMTALAALAEVWDSFSSLNLEAVRTGFADVEWPGRFQIMKPSLAGPTLLLDCAHNVDSAEKLALAIENDFDYERLWLILGITADKDIPGIINALMPLTGEVVVTASSHPRAASPEELQAAALEQGFSASAKSGVVESLLHIWDRAGSADLICITGSIFVVADLLNEWESLQSKINHREPVFIPHPGNGDR